MLILGAPGAGKTTLLLDLARTLSEQAHADENKPIPVLIDLAGWSAQPSRKNDDDPLDSPNLAGFVGWLLFELSTSYGIPAAVGRTWLRRGRLALLLDGLDEIAKPNRTSSHRCWKNSAAATGRQARSDLPDPGLRAPPQPAQPVRSCAHQTTHPATGPRLLRSRRARAGRRSHRHRAGRQVWDLVNSPLMLNVTILAYQGRAPEEVVAGGVADLRRELFDTYISEVLSRDRTSSRQYDSSTAVRSLWCLAWWTRSRAGDRTAVPRWLVPNGWYGLSVPEVDYLAHAVCLPALFAGLAAGATLDARAVRRTGRRWPWPGHTAARAPAAAPLAGLTTDGPKPQWAPLLALTSSQVRRPPSSSSSPRWDWWSSFRRAGTRDRGGRDRSVVRVELMVFHDNRRRLLLAVRLTVVVAAGWLDAQPRQRAGQLRRRARGRSNGCPRHPNGEVAADRPPGPPDDRTRAGGWIRGCWAVRRRNPAGTWRSAPTRPRRAGSRRRRNRRSGRREGLAPPSTGVRRAAVPPAPRLPAPLDRLPPVAPSRLPPVRRRPLCARPHGRGEYSFIHLLVRDHLAECAPNDLAAKVDRRIAERAARR